MRTDILRISPSSSNRGSYFTINSSRLIGAFTSISFVQPWSISGDFSFLLRAMTFYSTSLFVGNVCRLFAQVHASLRMFYGFCVHFCTAFEYVYAFCVHLCTDFVHLCGFFVRIRLIFCASCATFSYVYGVLCALSGFCVRIRLFVRYERLLRTDTAYWFLESFGYPILRFLWFVETPDDQILRFCWFVVTPDGLILRVPWFVESPDDPILRVLWFIESLCERSLWLDCLDDPSGGSDLQGSVELFIWRPARDSPSDLTWSISYPTFFSQFTIQSYLEGFLLIL